MKRLIWAAAAAALLSTSAAIAQTGPAQVKPASMKAKSPTRSSIQRTSHLYATKDGQQLYLDRIVDTSVKVAGKRPVILFSYGGGWETGSRTDKGFDALYVPYTDMGYTVIAIDYRLASRSRRTARR